MPETALALKFLESCCLCFVSINDESFYTRVQAALEHIYIIKDSKCEPAVSSAPENSAEIVALIECPSMIEKTCFCIIEIFDVHENLMDSLVDPLLIFVLLSHFVEEKYGHEQSIDPHLILIKTNTLTVTVGTCHMLEAALFCTRKTVHKPVCPVKAKLLEFRIMIHVVKLCKCKKRCCCINVSGRKTLCDVFLKPVMKELFVLLVVICLHNFQKSVKTNTLRPVPLADTKVSCEESNCLAAVFLKFFSIVRAAQVQQFFNYKI